MTFMPTGVNKLHVDRHLTNIVQNLVNTEMFIAPEVAPIVRVQKQTDIILSWPQEDWYREDDDKRSPGVEANMVGFDVTSLTYHAQNYALRGGVTVEDMANADPMLLRTTREGKAQFLARKLMTNWERRLANVIFSAANVGTSTLVASGFDDITNSDPVGTIQARMDQVHDAVGWRPNRILMGTAAWRKISRNKNVIDKANKTGVTGAARDATVDQVTALLEVDKILIGQQKYNSAQEGQGNTLADVWGDSVLCYYAPKTASMQEPSYMYSLRWMVPGVPDMRVENLKYDDRRKVNEFEIGYYQDEKVLTKELAGLLTNVTSSGSGGISA